jgi:hypothetical protein
MCLDLRSTTRLVYVDYITKNCTVGNYVEHSVPLSSLQKYKCLSKACSNSLKCYQSQYENKLVDNGSLGAFYKYVNCKLNGFNGIAPFKDVDGNLVITDSGKASLLNNYFCSVFTTDNGIIKLSSLLYSAPNSTTLPFFYTLPGPKIY